MTVHEQAAEYAWQRAAENFDAHQVCVEYRKRLMRGDYAPLDDVLWQGFRNERPNLAQVWAFSQMWGFLFGGHGDISMVRLELSGEAGANANLQHNQALLADVVNIFGDRSHLVRASGLVSNGFEESDGTLTLESDVFLTTYDGISMWHPTIRKRAACTFPLEIGYTKASRTLNHLMRHQGVARLPYGSRHLTILCVENPEIWTVRDGL